MTPTPIAPIRHARATALAAALASTALTAAAVPVSVTLDDLAPGLTMSAAVSRSVCIDGQHRFQSAGTLPLAESSRLVFESFTGLDGRPRLRSRVVTSYSGQAAEVSSTPPAGQRS